MSDKRKPVAKQMHQVCVVVNDLQAAVERYWNLFGIGPWQIYTFEPPELTDAKIRGKPEAYSMRLALAYVGDVQWELIQPLTGPSIYKEFLETDGEGVHHVSFAVDDYDHAIASMKERGIDVLMGGSWNGASFAYLDTEKDLGVIVELVKLSPEFNMPAPEATYPPPE